MPLPSARNRVRCAMIPWSLLVRWSTQWEAIPSVDGRRAGLPLGPQADDYLHVTTGKQARAAAMRAVRKVQSIPESDLADRCCLNECVCMFWCASRIPKTATAVSKGGALAESSQG